MGFGRYFSDVAVRVKKGGGLKSEWKKKEREKKGNNNANYSFMHFTHT